MRTKRVASAVFLLTSLTLLGAGCGQTTPASTNEPTTSPKADVSDNCNNPYYPFKKGLAISYHVSLKPVRAAAESDYTIRTVDVKGTTATIRAELAKGATADMTADCSSGSVALKGSAGLGATVQGVTFKTTVLSSSGTSMPTNMKAGTKWDHSESFKMEFTGAQAANMGTITSTSTEQSRAIGEESVTVPAGTYTAMKVEVKRTTSAAAKFGKIPATTDTSTEWWVKGIGMVKTVTDGDDGTTTIEATAVKGR